MGTKVRSLLCRYDFGYTWHNQYVGNGKQFICKFKQRLRDNLIQEWFSDINNSSKTQHYRNFIVYLRFNFSLKLTCQRFFSRLGEMTR